MDTRTCVSCSEAKPISGVWYLLAEGPGAFLCSSCYGDERRAAA